MELNRRDFVALTAVTICGGLAGCAATGGGAAEGTNLPTETNPSGPVDIGTAADYPADGVYNKHALADRIYVVRRGGRIYALRSDCTHKVCLLEPIGDDFRCPCHGSAFQIDGRVTKGPATKSMPHYAIARGADGRLTVDKSRRSPPEANDPAMSVTVG